MKPLQAAVSLSLTPFDFTGPEIAVMAASHNAEPVHVAAVRAILRKADVHEDMLQCPSVRPWDEGTMLADPAPARINSDCSGKHAGMLSACRARGWALDSYREPDHPLQRRVLEAVSRLTGLDSIHVGVDGCGVPVHGLPLRAIAQIYARLSTPARWGELGESVGRVVRSMTAEPYLVAGRDRVDTALMQTVRSLVVKGGAEALVCAAVLDRQIGVAVKIRDGTPRGAPPAMIRVLRGLDVIDEPSVEELRHFARPPVLGGGEPVGEIVADFDLAKP